MGNTASGNKGCFIKPKKAWRLLKTADEGNVTAYIFGVSGSGKTTLVSRYLGTRKYMVVDAGGIRPDDLVVESSNARKIIVIDNLHELSWGDVDTVREQIIELIRREDVWVILVGRCPVPPWLSAVRFQEGFYVVDSKLLMFSLEDIKKYAEYAGFSINEAQVQRMYYETTGLPLAVEMCHIKYMEMAYTSEITDDMYNDFSRRVEDEMCNYLEYHVYDNWDVEMQEFLMEISVVDEFTTKQA